MGHPSGKCRWLKEGVIWQKSNRFFARAEVRKGSSPSLRRGTKMFSNKAEFSNLLFHLGAPIFIGVLPF